MNALLMQARHTPCMLVMAKPLAIIPKARTFVTATLDSMEMEHTAKVMFCFVFHQNSKWPWNIFFSLFYVDMIQTIFRLIVKINLHTKELCFQSFLLWKYCVPHISCRRSFSKPTFKGHFVNRSILFKELEFFKVIHLKTVGSGSSPCNFLLWNYWNFI